MLRYLHTHDISFDPSTIEILSAALDEAWRQVQADKTYQLDGNAEGARDALAKHIVNMAAQGVRDPERLVLGALARFRL
jgi:hypothetical protein